MDILARLRTLELVDVPPGWQELNQNRAIANACLAGLDMIALVLYVCFCARSMPHTCLDFAFSLGGGLRLGPLCSRYSRRDAWLLTVIGNDAWSVGWHRLWHGSSIYWAVRSRMACSRYGPSIYVGESCCTAPRICEHILRILRPQGATQQPFFAVLRRGSMNVSVIRSIHPLRVDIFSCACGACLRQTPKGW